MTLKLKDVVSGQHLGSLQVGYDEGIAELKAVDMTDRGWVMLNMTKIARQLAPSFHPSYRLLLSVMQKQEQKQATKFARLAPRQQEQEETAVLPPPTTSSESSRKRTHNLSWSIDEGSAKRVRQEQESSHSPTPSEPKTPNQPIPP